MISDAAFCVLVLRGFTPDSARIALDLDDLHLLVHTGSLTVN